MKFGTVSGPMYGKQITLQQIKKPTAKKLWEGSEVIFIQDCNMRTFGLWQYAVGVRKEDDIPDFDQFVNDYAYYNCDNERGKYPVFFKRIK